jgi:hypothetical protein
LLIRDVDVLPPASLHYYSPIKKVFTVHLVPPASKDQDDDPRIAISYFIEYTEKRYKQALDGSLPYQFMLQRVPGKGQGEHGKKGKWWKK